MAQIFNSPYANTQVINVAGASISYKTVDNGASDPKKKATGKGNSLPFGVQLVTLQIQRPVSQSFSLATNNANKLIRYLYMGQTTGSLTLQGLFGPSSSLGDFAEALKDGCSSLTFWIKPSLSEGCGGSKVKGQTIKVFGCTLQSFGFQYQMGQGGIATIRYPIQFRLTGVQIIKPKNKTGSNTK